MLEKIKSNFNTQTWVLIPIAIGLNIAVGQIVLVLKLPVFLDSIGTVMVGVLCGPWAGALTGALSNVIWGIAFDPVPSHGGPSPSSSATWLAAWQTGASLSPGGAWL